MRKAASSSRKYTYERDFKETEEDVELGFEIPGGWTFNMTAKRWRRNLQRRSDGWMVDILLKQLNFAKKQLKEGSPNNTRWILLIRKRIFRCKKRLNSLLKKQFVKFLEEAGILKLQPVKEEFRDLFILVEPPKDKDTQGALCSYIISTDNPVVMVNLIK